jgi:hypothetical protein
LLLSLRRGYAWRQNFGAEDAVAVTDGQQQPHFQMAAINFGAVRDILDRVPGSSTMSQVMFLI